MTKKYKKPKVTKIGQDKLGKSLGFKEPTVKQTGFAAKILAAIIGKNGK